MSTHADTVRTIFDDAIALPRGERTAFLDRVCADDSALRRDVDSLLTNDDERPEDFLDALRLSLGELESGAIVGERYRLGERIGEGAVGVVYRAEQLVPVRRDVAIKVIKLGMDTKQVVGRFEAERQVLAFMDHPGIARVIDGGATDTGRPYFVMELVKGVPFTTYCDRYGLSLNARLDLFIAVCDAVRHAHQKGVIHRDLKPSNILVTVCDDSPLPKIIDFGIAKATSGRLGDRTFTAMDHFVGTPAYMSPEQAGLDDLDVDTRADIYSLGALLYEVLTGTTPFDATTVRDKGYDEIRRLVRDVEPLRPSARVRLTSSDRRGTALTEIADRRRTDPAALHRRLRGDLDWIVLKALEKDRTRRYDTVGAMADDIGRHRRNEPVAAGPPVAAYRIRKFVRRNRMPIAAAAAFALLLIGFTSTILREARDNRRLAASEHAAKLEAIGALGVADRERHRAERALHLSNVGRGRLFRVAGSLARAEDLLWREYLLDPEGPENHWALREFYAHHPCLRIVSAHDQPVAPALSPDGRFVATGGQFDDTVRLWETDGLRCRAALTGHTSNVRCVRFSPDGRTLASASFDETIRLWRMPGGVLDRVIETDLGGINSICFSPDSARLAAGSADGHVAVYDALSAERVELFGGLGSSVWSVRFSPDGTSLAAGRSGGIVHVWREGREPLELHGHQNSVRSLAFTTNGNVLATGSADRTIRVWDLGSGRCRATLAALNGTVRSLEFRSDDRTLVASGYWRLDEWDIDAERRLRQSPALSVLSGFALDEERNRVAVTSSDGTLRLLEDDALASLIRISKHEGGVSATLDPEARRLATNDGAGRVVLRSGADGTPVATLMGGSERGRSIAFDPTGRFLAAGSRDGVIRVWDAATRELVAEFEGHFDITSQGLAFSPDGRHLASTNRGRSITIREVGTWREVVSFAVTEAREVLSVSFSPDSRTLATTAREPEVRLWSIAGETRGTLDAPPSSSCAWTAAFHPDGKRLASGAWDGIARVWDLATGAEVARLEGHGAAIWDVAFSTTQPDLLATCSDDGTVRLWDTASELNLATFEPFGGDSAMTVEFSRGPMGVDRLLVTGADGTTLLWDLSYYDRHIASNVDYYVARMDAELGSRIQRTKLLAWKDRTLSRPSPGP